MKIYPDDGATVWVEFPEGKWVRAQWDLASKTYTPGGTRPIREAEVVSWSDNRIEDVPAQDPTAE